MSNLIMWNLIIGFLAPNVIAVVQQPKWSSKSRALFTVAASIIGGLGTAYFNDQFNAGDIVSSILVVAVAAITFYKGLFQPTGIAGAIENATVLPDKQTERGSVRMFSEEHVVLVLVGMGYFTMLVIAARTG